MNEPIHLGRGRNILYCAPEKWNCGTWDGLTLIQEYNKYATQLTLITCCRYSCNKTSPFVRKNQFTFPTISGMQRVVSLRLLRVKSAWNLAAYRCSKTQSYLHLEACKYNGLYTIERVNLFTYPGYISSVKTGKNCQCNRKPFRIVILVSTCVSHRPSTQSRVAFWDVWRFSCGIWDTEIDQSQCS